MERRFACHISEAFSDKKNQCHYLNNSIRKYGQDKFKLELLRVCKIDNADNIENEEFKIYIGDILIEVVEQQLKNNQIIFKDGDKDLK